MGGTLGAFWYQCRGNAPHLLALCGGGDVVLRESNAFDDGRPAIWDRFDVSATVFCASNEVVVSFYLFGCFLDAT